jgi:hypothetical protein
VHGSILGCGVEAPSLSDLCAVLLDEAESSSRASLGCSDHLFDENVGVMHRSASDRLVGRPRVSRLVISEEFTPIDVVRRGGSGACRSRMVGVPPWIEWDNISDARFLLALRTDAGIVARVVDPRTNGVSLAGLEGRCSDLTGVVGHPAAIADFFGRDRRAVRSASTDVFFDLGVACFVCCCCSA